MFLRFSVFPSEFRLSEIHCELGLIRSSRQIKAWSCNRDNVQMIRGIDPSLPATLSHAIW